MTRAVPGGPYLSFTDSLRAAAGLRVLRRQADLTPEGLSVKAGLPVSWTAARERGQARIRRGHADMAAAALGTDLAGLVAAGEQARQGAR